MAQKCSSLIFVDTGYYEENMNLGCVVKIQAWFRGCVFRLKRLPLILYLIKDHLLKHSIQCSQQNEDGRVNSSIDEELITESLLVRFGERIKKPSARMWYDILVQDRYYGWLPVNIKTTTTLTSDNIGNLATCVYSYTSEMLDLEKTCANGPISKLFMRHLQEKNYNKKNKKDYYFLVLNKSDKTDIILNSMKGLTVLTPNANNLPFQVCWNKNRTFMHKPIHKVVKQYIDCAQKPSPSWQEEFMKEMRLFKV